MNKKKIMAGLLGTVLMCSTAPAVYAVNMNIPVDSAATNESDIIFESGFENGEGVSSFTGRGGVEVIEAISTDSHSGSYSMKVSGREKDWNGPQLSLDNICEAETEYIVSGWVKAEWYNTVNVSLEYTDSSGTRKYPGIVSVVSQGDWVEIPETKFSFPSDVTNVYIYIQGTDTASLYVDDFSLKKAPVLDIEQDIKSLKDVYSPYFKLGTAVTASELSVPTRKSLIKKHFNSITLGNELKPDAILDRNASIAAGNDNPQVNLASARSILNYCRDNNIPVRGHVLVWHSQTPDWFFKENYDDNGAWVDKETMLKRMENYIKNVFAAVQEEYPTVDFYAWDVVNECFLDDGSARQPGEQGSSGSNNSAWVKVFGDNSFIDYAFRYARKYAPEGCKLYYNDFNEYMPEKTAAIVEMANRLKAEGTIDGIGMQSHLDVGFPTASAYEKALKAFVETGLDVQITELDITTSDTSEAGLEKQAKLYSDIMDLCVKYADGISAVVLWGTTDDASWRASRAPLLFNADYTAKPAFYSIVDGLDAPIIEPTTEPSTEPPTTEPTTVPPTTIEPEILWGDADLNGKLSISDAVKILSYASNPEKSPLENTDICDVYNHGDGIDSLDSLSVQKKITNVISELPESYLETEN